MSAAAAAFMIAAQPTSLLAQTSQDLTAAQKAEKKAKRKARKERQDAKKKAQQEKQAKKLKKKQKNAQPGATATDTNPTKVKKKKKKKATQEQPQKTKKKATQAQPRKTKKKDRKKDAQQAAPAQQTAPAKPSTQSGVASEQQKAERKHRARQAQRQKGHDVWYSSRRPVRYHGREYYVGSRRVIVVDNRYRNRYYHGRSIYYLPPKGAAIAVAAYVISAALAQPNDIYDALYAPPVIRVKHRYSIDQVVEDPQVRQMVRSVDMDINFATGSPEVPAGELREVDAVAHAMKRVLKQHPNSTFLVEGHTDATGDPDDNVLLSEDRAAAVVAILENEYGIPAANLQAVGYGAQYLKEDTSGPSRANRRVVVRNITGVLAGN